MSVAQWSVARASLGKGVGVPANHGLHPTRLSPLEIGDHTRFQGVLWRRLFPASAARFASNGYGLRRSLADVARQVSHIVRLLMQKHPACKELDTNERKSKGCRQSADQV